MRLVNCELINITINRQDLICHRLFRRSTRTFAVTFKCMDVEKCNSEKREAGRVTGCWSYGILLCIFSHTESVRRPATPSGTRRNYLYLLKATSSRAEDASTPAPLSLRFPRHFTKGMSQTKSLSDGGESTRRARNRFLVTICSSGRSSPTPSPGNLSIVFPSCPSHGNRQRWSDTINKQALLVDQTEYAISYSAAVGADQSAALCINAGCHRRVASQTRLSARLALFV